MQGEETIGDWTISQLIRWLQTQLQQNPPISALTLGVDNMQVNKQLTCLDQIQFLQAQSTVGSAGSASALPANPQGYIRILDYTGAVGVIPYYKAS